MSFYATANRMDIAAVRLEQQAKRLRAQLDEIKKRRRGSLQEGEFPGFINHPILGLWPFGGAPISPSRPYPGVPPWALNRLGGEWGL